MPNRFALKFTKEGYVKYISHLDLLRVFKRSFKTAGLPLRYSQGFNPHPKMSFAQPLSLGYSSRCELIEFETRLPHETDEVILKLKGKLPLGVELLDCYDLDNVKASSLAAFTDSCEYIIGIPTDTELEVLGDMLQSYVNQDKIIALKKSKKTKELKEVDIKPMIRSIEIGKTDKMAIIKCLLDGGSTSNLSPELVITTFLQSSKISCERYDIEVERTAINFVNNLQF